MDDAPRCYPRSKHQQPLVHPIGAPRVRPLHGLKIGKDYTMDYDDQNFVKFAGAMFEAIAFTDLDCPDCETYGAELSEESKAKMESDARQFWDRCKHLIEHNAIEQAGHDFWLTRNGHGAGFWDRSDDLYLGWDKFLAEVSKEHGEVWICLGDDGFAHAE